MKKIDKKFEAATTRSKDFTLQLPSLVYERIYDVCVIITIKLNLRTPALLTPVIHEIISTVGAHSLPL